MVSIKYLFQKHKKENLTDPKLLNGGVCVCVCVCVCVFFSFVFRGLTDNNKTVWESVNILWLN